MDAAKAIFCCSVMFSGVTFKQALHCLPNVWVSETHICLVSFIWSECECTPEPTYSTECLNVTFCCLRQALKDGPQTAALTCRPRWACLCCFKDDHTRMFFTAGGDRNRGVTRLQYIRCRGKVPQGIHRKPISKSHLLSNVSPCWCEWCGAVSLWPTTDEHLCRVPKICLQISLAEAMGAAAPQSQMDYTKCSFNPS